VGTAAKSPPQTPLPPHGSPAGASPWAFPSGGGGGAPVGAVLVVAAVARRRASCDARACRRPVETVLPGSRCSPWRSAGRRAFLASVAAVATPWRPCFQRRCLRPRGGPGRRSWWRREALPTIPPGKEFARLLQPRVTAVHPAGTGTPPAAPLRVDDRSVREGGVCVKDYFPVMAGGRRASAVGSRQWAVGSGQLGVGSGQWAVDGGGSGFVPPLPGGGTGDRRSPGWGPSIRSATTERSRLRFTGPTLTACAVCPSPWQGRDERRAVRAALRAPGAPVLRWTPARRSASPRWSGVTTEGDAAAGRLSGGRCRRRRGPARGRR
jgi:hypothetical protein